MKPVIKTVSRALVGIATLAVTAYVFAENPSYASMLSTVSLPHLAIVVFFSTLIHIGNAFLLKRVLDPFEIDLSIRRALAITVAGRVGNLISPLRAGDALKAVYLKKKANLPYTHFLSILIATYVLSFLVVAVIGLVVLSASPNIPGPPGLLAAFAISAAACLLLLRAKPPLPFEIVEKVWSGWEMIRENRVLPSLIAILAFNLASSTLAMMAAFASFGASVGLMQALMLAVVNSYSRLITLTPGNLGAKELALSYTLALFGGSLEEGMAASVVVRVAELLSLAALFAFSLASDAEKDGDITGQTSGDEAGKE